jgi:F1F0 ATPase subunit 2
LIWLLGAFALGFAAGAAYFAALWATVRALPASRHPALVLFGSFVLRFGVVAAVFVMIVRGGGFSCVASALAGFVLARLVIVRRSLPPETAPSGEAT